MNKKQIDLLIENGYEVLEDIGYIHELSFSNPRVCIVYNSLLKQFCLLKELNENDAYNKSCYALNGIGSNSCGPQVMEPYAFSEENFSFTVKLIPEKI